MIALLAWMSCAAEPIPPPPADAPKVETMLGEVTGIVYIGDWTSTGCKSRTYARNLHITSDHGYAGIDLVSPCPPGKECMWSGIVGFAGIWKQEDRTLHFREIGAPIAKGSPHPTEVTADTKGNLVENGCVYTRGVTVPPGYTEAQVTPKVPGSG